MNDQLTCNLRIWWWRGCWEGLVCRQIIECRFVLSAVLDVKVCSCATADWPIIVDSNYCSNSSVEWAGKSKALFFIKAAAITKFFRFFLNIFFLIDFVFFLYLQFGCGSIFFEELPRAIFNERKKTKNNVFSISYWFEMYFFIHFKWNIVLNF